MSEQIRIFDFADPGSLVKSLANLRIGSQTNSEDLVLVNPSIDEVIYILLGGAKGRKVALFANKAQDSTSDEVMGLIQNRFATSNQELHFFTSGTTGNPKVVSVDTNQLFDSVSHSHLCNFWGMTYEPFRMSGLQMLSQVIASRSKLAVPDYGLDPRTKLKAFLELGVRGVSATPSFFRLALSGNANESSKLEFITLGGEIADKSILDKIKKEFSSAKISHVYATSETGSVFSVSDGQPGFPDSFVGKVFKNGKQLAIEDGELIVLLTSLTSSVSQKIRTGDLVERIEDRWHFAGRASQIINVGAQKVSLTQVEHQAMSVDGVLDAQASATPNPFLGHVVELKVVLRDPSVLDSLSINLRQNLPRHAVPAVIEPVGRISLSDAFKKIRGSRE